MREHSVQSGLFAALDCFAATRNARTPIAVLLSNDALHRLLMSAMLNLRQGKPKNDRSRGPGISGHPRAHHHARRSAAGDASPGARHLFQRDGGADRTACSPISSKLFATKGQSYIYIANGHGAWEATLSNVLSRGDKVLVLESGRFAIGWGNAAAAMGAEVEVLKGDWRRAIRPAEVEARLKPGQGSQHQGDRSRCRSIPRRAPITTSRRSARRSRRPAIRRCSWSTPWRRSAACRSRWMHGASTSRCPARRRA